MPTERFAAGPVRTAAKSSIMGRMSSGARHMNDHVVRAVEAAADVFTGRGRLRPTHANLWRHGRHPHKDDGRMPGEAGYVRRGPGGEIGPRFGEGGDPGIDREMARNPVRERSDAVLRKWSAPAS